MPLTSVACLISALAFRSDAASVICGARELAFAVYEQSDYGRTFDITATCTRCRSARIFFRDDSGAMVADCRSPECPEPQPGDTIHLVGSIARGPVTGRACADCKRIDRLAHGLPPPPLAATGPDILGGKLDFELIRTTGEVLDVFSDETDPEFVYLQLNCQNARILVPTAYDNPLVRTSAALIGAHVEIVGVCEPAPYMDHWRIGRIVKTDSGHIALVNPAHDNLFAAPEIKGFRRMQPEDLSRLGRHRATGRVLARWNGNRILLRTTMGELVTAELATEELPDCETTVEIVGFPETDLYSLSLIRANWRPAAQPIVFPPESAATNLSVRAIITDESGRARFNTPLHGRIVRLRGIVRSLPPQIAATDRRIYLESDDITFSADVGSIPGVVDNIALGSEICVTGVCIMETHAWRPNADFANIRGFVLVPRTAEDVQILSTPSWWTRSRLLFALTALLLLVVAFLVWNISLHRLVERRGQELTRESIARAESDIRTLERTRLAVELHDSIAQNLTSVTMEIDTAGQYVENARPELRQHLMQAARTLKSCRNEVRNCLWDLRSNALEEPDFARAIRLTLLPYVKDTEITVRFPVPRTKITDNTTHEILRIIRELVMNSTRHGGATQIKIAGSIEGDRLKFSVQDNGCGFTPETAPGVSEGHFGLQGVRERVARMDGRFSVRSVPGSGAKVTIDLWTAGGKNPSP